MASQSWCRTPQGVRGLKLDADRLIAGVFGRTPQGVRGLKCSLIPRMPGNDRRTPQGVRGLKYNSGYADIATQGTVAPRKGCVD